MKYLHILVFAALCFSSNGDDPLTIKDYNLELNLQPTLFIGTLTLKLKDTNSAILDLDIGSNIQMTECKYSKVENKDPDTSCTIGDNAGGKIKITMADRKSDVVKITYEGKYMLNGLYSEQINNKNYYFASFANGAAANVLPCHKTDNSAFKIKFLQNPDNMRSNIERIKDTTGNVRLEDIVIMHGEFVKMSNDVSNTVVDISGVINCGAQSKKGIMFSNEVLKKMSEVLGKNAPTSNTPVQQYLFPSSTLRDINGRFFTTHSVKNYVIDDKMDASGEQSLRTNLIQRLAQHWFGAGTTSDKWLNMGLSAFLAHYALDKWPVESTKSKKFQALDQLVVDQLQLRAFEADGFASSPSLKSFNTKTTTYDDVLSDPILYSKAAAIMRSLSVICGDEKFKVALISYAGLTSSITVDKFAECFKDCFKTVDEGKSFLKRWHEASGYPVVHVQTINATVGTFKLTQENFGWMNGGDKKIWSLPISYYLSNGADGKIWLTESSADLHVNEKVDWIILNVNYNGYYRANYDMNTWNKIISQLENNHTKIAEVSRAQIIDDIFSFARSVRNYTKPVPGYEMAIKLFKYLEKEEDYIPLKAAFNAMEFLDHSLVGSEDHQLFRGRVTALLNSLYKSNPLNVSHTDHVKNILAREVGSWACRIGFEGCVTLAKQYYKNKTDDDKFTLPPNTEDIVYCTIVSNDADKWDVIFERLKFSVFSSQHTEILKYVNALGCTKDVSRVKRLITWSESNSKYQFEVISSLFNGNPGNIQTTLEILRPQKKAANLDVKQVEKIVQLSLSKLNEANAKSLSTFIKEVLPEGNEMRKETESVLSAIDEWNKQKVAELHEALTSGESRTKPFAVILTLCAALPVFNYFLRY